MDIIDIGNNDPSFLIHEIVVSLGPLKAHFRLILLPSSIVTSSGG